MIGLASMAAELASQRMDISLRLSIMHGDGRLEPVRRRTLIPHLSPVSAEYYRIIDRLTRGDKP